MARLLGGGCVVAVLLATSAAVAQPQWQPPKDPAWQDVDVLVRDQKLDEASKLVEQRLTGARQRNDTRQWTKALIRLVQLRIGLHGYETAVRLLMEQPWPQDELSSITLQLFYAQALMKYLDAHSWEIRQREPITSAATVDLKAWTTDQIVTEIHRAFFRIWRKREMLGRTPLSALADFVEANDYPAGIRDSVRDLASYLWVQQLANSAYWSSAQSNELYLLDLGTLLRGDRAAMTAVALDDPAVHPMRKLSAILDDLESWHSATGGKEGALEARLERSRRLFAAFSSNDDREAIRADLERRLPAFAAVPWWSEGMAVLARFFVDGDEPVHARDTARQGQARFPESFGGKSCDAIVRRLEAPDYDLQSMSEDGPQRRSIRVSHRNVPRLYFRAYPLDVEARFASGAWPPSVEEQLRFVHQERALQGWSVELPATVDLRSHVTFVTPPLTQPGGYLIVASAREDFADSDNRLATVTLVVTDLALTVVVSDSVADVRIWDGDTGEPVSDAELEARRSDWRGVQTPVTIPVDRSGFAQLSADKLGTGTYVLIARRRGQVAVDRQGVSLYPRARPPARSAALVYTDRAIYRPQQKILWKIVAYDGSENGARFHVQAHKPATVTLFDGNNQKVEERTVTTNEFGSAAGEFNIPAGRLLGMWRIQSTPQGYATVRVEEYKRPTFETTIGELDGPARLNHAVTVRGDARYYFGLPVTDGHVKWRVTREILYPWWWAWWGTRRTEAPQQVAAGQGSLQSDGSFRIELLPRADERLAKQEGITYRYRIEVTVTDSGGESRSASKAIVIGFVAVQASIDVARGFLEEKTASDVSVHRSDLNGNPSPGDGAWRLTALRQPERTVSPADLPRPAPKEESAERQLITEGDRLRARWDPQVPVEAQLREWPEGQELARGKLQHDAQGNATLRLPPLPAGVYRISYETVDPFGARAHAESELVVASPKLVASLPALVRLDESTVAVGHHARLLVTSGFPDQSFVVEIRRPQTPLERRFIRVGRDPALLDIGMGERDRGVTHVSVYGMHDYQLLTEERSISVPFDNKDLSVELSTFRDRIRPGGREVWRVTVKGPQGRVERRTAEVLAFMYDQSLDAFAKLSPPTPRGLFNASAPSAWLRAVTSMNGGGWLSNQWKGFWAEPSLRGDELRFLDGYAIGGPGMRLRGGGVYRKMAPSPRAALVAPGAAMKVEKKQSAEALGGLLDRADIAASAPTSPAIAPRPIPATELRSSFAETAFWRPQLLTDREGTATIELTVPDSVTSWDVWIEAITKDLASGSLEQHARSVKELMVRPYVPRFLREGDQAELRVEVNNASDHALRGTLSLAISDPETHADLANDFGLPADKRGGLPFEVAAGKSATLRFPITTPRRVGMAAFKVTGSSGEFSDGELRPLPILPSRLHLAQSRFVVLHGPGSRTMTFADLAKNDDPSRINDQLVVTVDAQLFYGVLQALPYLVNYPYECTEQTLNRFVSSGVVSSLFDRYPAVATMAKQLAKRTTQLAPFDAADPNRKMQLEETPWVREAHGGDRPSEELINVLDPRVAAANRDSALAKLRKTQLPGGGFPWFPGGPPSLYMTVYIAEGLSRATEYGVEVPKPLVQSAWRYIASWFQERSSELLTHDSGWELLTFFNYVASSYSDESWTGGALTLDQRKQILDFCFRHWREHSPYLKGYLALTLHRMGRAADAKTVWDSVMDSAKTTADQGTFFAPEDRAWLWYNDTVETQAFALRVLMELSPKDPRQDGLVQWLFVHKKLSQWKSTRATAEVIYALVKYLERQGTLGQREDVSVQIGRRTVDLSFDPAQFTGEKNHVVVPGPQIDPETSSTIDVSTKSRAFELASATWQFSTEKLPADARGDFFGVERRYFRRVREGAQMVLEPLSEGARLSVGDELEVQLSLTAKHAAEYVHLRDPRGAGFEPEGAVSGYKWDLGLARYEEIRDSGANFFFEWLPAGQYTLKYRVRANMSGTFRVGPATVQSMYAPEFNAYSSGAALRIDPQ